MEEANYATIVITDSGRAPKEKKEDPTIYSEVKPKGASTTALNGEAAASSEFVAVAVCSAILCVFLLVSLSVIIYISVEMKEQEANLNSLMAANEQLIEERTMLERETEELSNVTDNLNRTLGVVLKFDTFPVSEYCPDKKCQPCRKDWILFKEKCYLFYEEDSPWKTWRRSQRFCENAVAGLVVIDDLHEQEFISNHIKYYYDKFHGYWIGLREATDQNWVWVDGRNDTLGFWATKESGSLCGLMIPGRNLTASWNPSSCIMKNKLICESDALIRSDK